jgi:hypothetical protein
VLINIYNVQGAYVRRLPTMSAAIATWRQALINGNVTPLDIATPLDTISEHPISSMTLPHCFGVIDVSATSLTGTPNQWQYAKYQSGPKWVVWKGRLPGVLDSWYGMCSDLSDSTHEDAQGHRLMLRYMA